MTTCQQCGVVADDDEQAAIDRATSKVQAVKPTGWICTTCRPSGFPADGLCYSVLEVCGSSTEGDGR
jgi:hypothetical protein